MTPEELRNALATSIQETAAMKNVLAEATRQAMQATMVRTTYFTYCENSYVITSL